MSKKLGQYKNELTGKIANMSGKSIKKLTSGKALVETLKNGFTSYQHYEAVSRVNNLYKKARYVTSEPDRNGSPDVFLVHKYNCPFKLKSGKKANAYITVKEYADGTNKIYSLELRK
ncbi:MAG: hypothetical protein IJJ66_05590 [Treponema sp.]|nr:hypothetical protein [Treponema sp.]MBR0476269.1 hypothetical protein [Treponema sp.]